jgi:hypothetical protein
MVRTGPSGGQSLVLGDKVIVIRLRAGESRSLGFVDVYGSKRLWRIQQSSGPRLESRQSRDGVKAVRAFLGLNSSLLIESPFARPS